MTPSTQLISMVNPADKSAPRRNAGKLVAEIYELCESVLSHLGTKDLLQAQYVCRTMRSIISRSAALQTKLFYLPGAVLEKSWSVESSGSGSFMIGKRHRTASRDCSNQCLHMTGVRTCVYNPLALVPRSAGPKAMQQRTCLLEKILEVTRKGSHCIMLKYNPEIVAQKGSCCQMFLTQPPVTRVAYRLPVKSTKGGQVSHKTHKGFITNDAGLTFADVVRGIETVMKLSDSKARLLPIDLVGVFAMTAETEQLAPGVTLRHG
ncbi:hypothetical protein LTR56_010221 [Elasticomyces elasticus]|nr:hypothetical protein LTR22_017229 [Elasticomyces elasticus]KAK3643483.1 hypothetical protein LTR56_010221 [Elasticomyces elasticus]KAK4925309.1 hypothetical protein LTR49_007607 [Elasticomyces elasticus]KAK5761320.1 hypothetical protein LTS12_008596 [Elasticomyces elasticus]